MVGKVIRSLACCAVALALVSSARAVAAPFTWNGGTTGTWTSAANWLPSTTWSGSTNNADTATFLTGDATTVTIPNNQIFLNALTVNRDLTINGTSSTFSTGTAYTQAANTSVTIGLTNASALFRMGHASSQAFNTLGSNASLTVNVSATTTGQSVCRGIRNEWGPQVLSQRHDESPDQIDSQRRDRNGAGTPHRGERHEHRDA